MKTNKSYAKRVKVTKKGKVLHRKPGQNHFNAKESRVEQLNKNRPKSNLNISSKQKSRFLSGSGK
jgi:ribosomal protein L35